MAAATLPAASSAATWGAHRAATSAVAGPRMSSHPATASPSIDWRHSRIYAGSGRSAAKSSWMPAWVAMP
eukprot:8762574-Lingulodinium_polyedra.AAC.1